MRTSISVQAPAVGRGPAGVVAVSWQQANRVPCCDAPWPIRVRVSTDGGVTFGTSKTLAYGWEPLVAVGDGVVYVAVSSPTSMSIHRSTDGGATWTASAEFPLSTYGTAGKSITAVGKVAYVAYGDYVISDDDNDANPSTGWVRYHRTSDRGKTWSAGTNLTSSAKGSGANDPVLSLKSGVLRVIYQRPGEVVVYRQRPEGGSWTAEQQVSPGAGYERPAGVGHATRTVVLYTAESASAENVFVRTGTP